MQPWTSLFVLGAAHLGHALSEGLAGRSILFLTAISCPDSRLRKRSVSGCLRVCKNNVYSFCWMKLAGIHTSIHEYNSPGIPVVSAASIDSH